MPPKLAGHALQLLGYSLTFLGLAVVVVALFAAGSYPGVSLWVFVSGGIVVGAPLMIAGGRIDSRGRELVLGMSPEEAVREYRQGVVLLAVYLAVLLLQGFWVAAPMFLCVFGLAQPGDPFVSVWIVTWVLLFCAGREWITRPLMRAAARRIREQRSTP